MVPRVAALLMLLWWLHGLPEVRGICSNNSGFSAQIDTLLAEYDRDSPPEEYVKVELALDPRHASVIGRSSAVKLLADLRMSWMDRRLAWNATELGCDSTLTSVERLWRPDIAMVNAAATSDGDAPLRARLNSDGSIAWIWRLDAVVPVALDLEDWPNDVQTCTFKFSSRAHTFDELDIVLKDLKFATVFEAAGWEILSLIGSTAPWGPPGEQKRLAMWTLSLRRHEAAHAHVTSAMLTAVVLLLLCAMLLPPVSRAPLFATASFTAALWLSSVVGGLPGAGSGPRAVRLVGALCACGGAGCACAALVLRLARRAQPPPPPALRALLATASAFCVLTPPQMSTPPAQAGADGAEAEGVSAWAAVAQLLDYVLLAALGFTVFIVVCLYL